MFKWLFHILIFATSGKYQNIEKTLKRQRKLGLGNCISYDAVLQFRKSAAKYVIGNAMTLHQIMGLSRTVRHVFGWYDSFDLSVSTLNKRHEIFAIGTEFQVHPAGIIQPGTWFQGLLPNSTHSLMISGILHLCTTLDQKCVPSCSENVSFSYTEVCGQ